MRIKGKLIIFHNPNKWNCTRLRLLSPFVMLLDGVVELILLPTPYSSYIYSLYLHAIFRGDMKYRIKQCNDGTRKTL
jgi:hypothetical protein